MPLPPDLLATWFANAFASAANRLLRQDHAVREQLAAFAGNAVEIRIDPAPALQVIILPDGTFAPTAVHDTASASVRLTPALLKSGRWADALEISGDASLGEAIRVAARSLRWDAENALAPWIGDAAAHRAAAAAKSFAEWQRDAATRLVENVMEYAIDERGLGVRRSEGLALAEEIERLQERLDRLEAAVTRLETAPRGH